MANGSAYERVTRNMVTNLENTFGEFKTEIRDEFASLKSTNKELYNHLSSRLPPWATIVITLLTAVVSAFAGIRFG